MITAELLDVTLLAPRLKHPTVFEYFDRLEAGESFMIRNDHDPKPLYYELIAERGPIFTWEYLEKGPEWYRVEIKKNEILPEDPLATIPGKDIAKAQILKEKNVQFGCASEEKDSTLPPVKPRTQNSAPSSFQEQSKWSLEFLCDYIVETHHRFVKERVEPLNDLAQKVAEHHGQTSPLLYRFATMTYHFLQDLLDHQVREEEVLFPMIKKAVAYSKDPSQGGDYEPGILSQPRALLEEEHHIAFTDMDYLKKLSNEYSVPEDACNSRRLVYRLMEEFQEDLLTHLRLEEQVLFPRMIALDEQNLASTK